ncbi:MAG: hypothetical protein ACOCXH_08130 [Cyclobacteriaceae bacterium]
MYSRKIENFFPRPVIIPAYFLAIAGIVLIFFEWIIAIFLVATALFIISGHEGIIIDGNNKKFKIYYSIFFIKFGSWDQLPGFNRLLLVPEQTQIKTFSFTSNKSITENKFGVRLYYPDSSDYILASKTEKSKAKEDAEFLAKMLGLKLEDFSHVKLEELQDK